MIDLFEKCRFGYVYVVLGTTFTDAQDVIYYDFKTSSSENPCDFVIDSALSDVTIRIVKFHLSADGCPVENVTVRKTSHSDDTCTCRLQSKCMAKLQLT